MKIRSHDLDNKILIVAEIGNNHEGNFNQAKKLIKSSADAGADAVKFQSFITKSYVLKNSNPDRYKLMKKFELTQNQFKKLKDYAHKLGLLFISTPLDINSAKYLNNIVDAYKISSGDINFYPMIEIICKSNKPLIISTGVSPLNEIKKTINFIKRYRKLNNVLILHCVSSYPTKNKDASLSNIFHLKKISKNIGYSDHTIGINAALCSVSMGIKLLEKHITLDNKYSSFRDHKISSNPKEFKSMVKKIRLYEIIIGSNNFKSLNTKDAILIKRSLVAKKDLKKDKIINQNDITWLRPGNGEAPGNEKSFIGKKLIRDISNGEQLKRFHIKK